MKPVTQATDKRFQRTHDGTMEIPTVPRVTYAERLNGGVIITFEDGKCALYSAALLSKTFTQDETMPDEFLEDED